MVCQSVVCVIQTIRVCAGGATCVSLCVGQSVEGLRIVEVVEMTTIAILTEIAMVKMTLMMFMMMT